jgi:ABC-2 type transport system ATP-binding protein
MMHHIPTSPVIEVRGLGKSFGRHTVLNDVSFSVNRGEIFALLGPNGAGKTTIVHILTTLLPADAGKISVAGYDMTREAAEVRRQIGLTGQYAAVDDFQTGEENLLMMARLAHLDRKTARTRAAALLEQFDLVDAAKRPVSSWSGGMRRRIDLAMSLLAHPNIVFLDEPTTGLDPRSRLALWGIVRDLARSGVTIFLTTQYLEEADRLADTVAVIDAGRIIAMGPPEDLKRRVSEEHVELDFESASDLQRAMDAIDLTTATIVTESLRIRVRTAHPARTISDMLGALDRASIPVANIAIVKPTLDDVFLSLTGRPAEVANETEHGVAA